MKHLIYAVILLAGLVAIPNSSQANSIVCQYSNTMDPYSIIVYRETEDREGKDAIQNVTYNIVEYFDGRKIYMNEDLIKCHKIFGKKDEAEARIVDEFINMLEYGSDAGELE